MKRTIFVVGRRWFQKTYGNTYHTAEVFVDGKSIGKSGKAYGYGDQFQQTAMQMLIDAGVYKSGDLPRLAARDAGDEFSYTVVDVPRERDL